MKLSFSNPRARALTCQAITIVAALGLGAYLVSNTLANLQERQIASGFGFLGREAGFAIGETSFIPYTAADSYLRALTVGLANTLRVSLLGIFAATILGTLIGLARLSHNWLLAKLAAAYVECVVGGEIHWGVGLDPNIVTASLRAVVSAVNRAA